MPSLRCAVGSRLAMIEDFFRAPHPQLAISVPVRHGSSMRRASPRNRSPNRGGACRSLRRSQSRGRRARPLRLRWCLTRARGSRARSSSTTRRASSTRCDVTLTSGGASRPAQWRVTPGDSSAASALAPPRFHGGRPFFCQVEAVETLIWLTEVAPHLGQGGGRSLSTISTESTPMRAPGFVGLP